MDTSHVLLLQCKDRPGIVSAVTTLLFECGANITEAQQFDDAVTGRFFMRIQFDLPHTTAHTGDLHTCMKGLGERLELTWSIRAVRERKRVLILVSRYDHCLADLIYRTRTGELHMEIVAIAGNHPLESLNIDGVGNIPYHHLPVTRENKSEQEAQLRGLIERTGAELVVLARYMQILSDDFARFLAGRCINIHHSFLPGFKGAQPYHQAYNRGVKMIGATAHYVTGDLDEGPIIEQDVVHVSHTDTPELLTRKGRDVERRVLSRAVLFHVQDRVLINGNKTVVFRS